MNPEPSPCERVRERLLDRVDGLLDPQGEALVDAHVAACPACAEEARRAARRLALLTAPWPVAEGRPPPVLVVRAGPRAVAWLPRLAAHAATFAAGVAAALLLARVPAGPVPSPAAPAATAPTAEAPVSEGDAGGGPSSVLLFPRRIR